MQSGDTVRLKSGGPLMTVDSLEQINGRTMVHCIWFDHDHNEKNGSYPETMLVEDDGVPRIV
jgi:uncharacterized protein YodC (DUF2158 family)